MSADFYLQAALPPWLLFSFKLLDCMSLVWNWTKWISVLNLHAFHFIKMVVAYVWFSNCDNILAFRFELDASQRFPKARWQHIHFLILFSTLCRYIHNYFYLFNQHGVSFEHSIILAWMWMFCHYIVCYRFHLHLMWPLKFLLNSWVAMRYAFALWNDIGSSYYHAYTLMLVVIYLI